MSWPKLQRTTLCSGVIAEQRLRQRAVWVHSPPLAAHVQALISDDAKRQGQAYQKLRERRQLLSSEIPRRLRRGSFIGSPITARATSRQKPAASRARLGWNLGQSPW